MLNVIEIIIVNVFFAFLEFNINFILSLHISLIKFIFFIFHNYNINYLHYLKVLKIVEKKCKIVIAIKLKDYFIVLILKPLFNFVMNKGLVNW